MRYASRLDYFLFNALFLREGLAPFAHGQRHPLPLLPPDPGVRCTSTLFTRRRGDGLQGGAGAGAHRGARARHRAGESLLPVPAHGPFAFSRLRSRRGAVEPGRRASSTCSKRSFARRLGAAPAGAPGSPGALLAQGAAGSAEPLPQPRLRCSDESPIGPRQGHVVSSPPTGACTSRWASPIDLAAHSSKRSAARRARRSRIARKVRRSILMFLYREEKVVEGPTLRRSHKVQEIVVAAPGVQRRSRERARSAGPRARSQRARAEAEKIFREIAANMNSTVLAVFNADRHQGIMRRVFVVDRVLIGLEKVAEYAKRNPLVLAPEPPLLLRLPDHVHGVLREHLVPPHIVGARQHGVRSLRLSVPSGWRLLSCGASFDDPLYKAGLSRLRRAT